MAAGGRGQDIGWYVDWPSPTSNIDLSSLGGAFNTAFMFALLVDQERLLEVKQRTGAEPQKWPWVGV